MSGCWVSQQTSFPPYYSYNLISDQSIYILSLFYPICLFLASAIDIVMENVNEMIGSDTKVNVIILVFDDRLLRTSSSLRQ